MGHQQLRTVLHGEQHPVAGAHAELVQARGQALGLGRKYDLSFVDRMTVKALGRYLNRKPIPGSPPDMRRPPAGCRRGAR